ncbi:MAG: hypothetical protein AAGE96_00475, partial [Cyanobacteria bacterium P01_G01_bin.19]
MPRKKAKSTSRKRKTTSFLEKSQVGISLTSQAFQNLNEIVEGTGLSKSKVVEGLVTGNIAIASKIADKVISIESNLDNESSDSLNTKIQILDGSVAEENQSLNQESSTKSSLKEEPGDIAELEKNIQEHENKYQSLSQSFQEKEDLIKKLERQLQEQKAAQKTQETQENSSLAEIDSLKQQLSETKEKTKSAEQTAEAYKTKIEELEQQLNDTVKEKENLSQQSGEKEEALSQLQQQLSERENEVESIKSDRD